MSAIQGKLDHSYGLAFETSSAMGSVALGRGGDHLESRSLSGPRRHAVEFIPTVAQLCADRGVGREDISIIYVSSGPGSFTGLRIAATAARMIGLATGARIVSVPTLEVIAQNARDVSPPPQRVAVILDAKRGRVYAATFTMRQGRYLADRDPIEADNREFLSGCAAQQGSLAVLGEGVRYHREAVEESGLPVLSDALFPPRAETVYRLGFARASAGEFVDRRHLTPTYIRPPEAEEKWQQRHGSVPS